MHDGSAARQADVPLSVRLRDLRKRYGLTQTQLADLIGVSFASVNRWENGQGKPHALARRWLERAEQEGLPHVAVAPSGARIADGEVAEVPPLDFAGEPRLVRLVAEGERLASGYLVNSAFATELSLIEPLPHQRIAVYERMLPQPHLRFLLADDAGAGKTIMSGLYIREMLSRQLVKRVLVVPPAGLVLNWERELNNLFGLPFRVVSGGEARTSNPFAGADGDLVIVSVDTLAGERTFARLQEPNVQPYDLVIFDEAHKLSADREPDLTIRRTDRYRLAEALAGIPSDDSDRDWSLSWSPWHLLLLTATPHMGKDIPYYFLWRLLEPEALSTVTAFEQFPADARSRHFVRRTKEEMVRFDGTRLYPTRISDTLSYDLTTGPDGEQALYDETTDYMRRFYNSAQILNRSAAQLAMSVFQRRLASSTYALLRSFERRLERLDRLIADLGSGKVTIEQLRVRQLRLKVHDLLEEKTADEELQGEDDAEEHEAAEAQALEVVAVSLEQLEAERAVVKTLITLARRVYERAAESKFDKLRQVIQDPRYRDEKLIIFTEHRDTLAFLVRRLEGLGYAGQVAQIHGGMAVQERDRQVQFFRKPIDQGGATYLVATDAAGEGINLQFCWIMVNYDVPWNPARLEQRMGRIHRYGQQHDPVVIINLVAGKTREGHVVKTLLDKLETIRRQLGSDKVYDVIGRLFQGVSLRDYIQQAVTAEGAAEAERAIKGKVTKEQVAAMQEAERRRYGDGGDVARELPRLRLKLREEIYRRLLPGYVRGFVKDAAPALGLRVAGDLDERFTFAARDARALDPFLSVLDRYDPEARKSLTVFKPSAAEPAIFLRPGEPLFERLREQVSLRFGRQALRGGIFVDASATRPYLFHLIRVTVVRRTDPDEPGLQRGETLEERLVGVRQYAHGDATVCPAETLLLLGDGRGVPQDARPPAGAAPDWEPAAVAHARDVIAREMATRQAERLRATLKERVAFVELGYGLQEAELASARTRYQRKVNEGDVRAKGELTRVRNRQRTLAARRDAALAALRRAPELVDVGEVACVAHALVVPSRDPEVAREQDARTEAIAVRLACAFEEARGGVVTDVSTPDRAVAAGLTEHPGFDLLSERPDGTRLHIEVKGRAGNAAVELTENEYRKACNLGDSYWLYAAFDCASYHPRLSRVRDPFSKLVARSLGGVQFTASEIAAQAEEE